MERLIGRDARMSRDSGSNTVRMAVRPIELWRTARWHCECGYSPHEWTLRLFVDEVIATECVVDNVAGMVRIAQQWRHAVSGWMRINASHRTAVDRQSAPDRNDEYLFYQSLLGAWPAEPIDAPVPPAAHPCCVTIDRRA